MNCKFSDYDYYNDDYFSQGHNIICNKYIKSNMQMCNVQVTRDFLHLCWKFFEFPKFPGSSFSHDSKV